MTDRLPQELLEPSQCPSEPFEQLCKPSCKIPLDIVAGMLTEADDLTISRCASNIIWQCLLFVFGRERIARMSPESVLNASTIQPITAFIHAVLAGWNGAHALHLRVMSPGNALGMAADSGPMADGA